MLATLLLAQALAAAPAHSRSAEEPARRPSATVVAEPGGLRRDGNLLIQVQPERCRALGLSKTVRPGVGSDGKGLVWRPDEAPDAGYYRTVIRMENGCSVPVLMAKYRKPEER